MEGGSEPRVVVQETKAELKSVEGKVEELLQLYSQGARAEVGQPVKERKQEHNRLYQESYDWLRTAKQRNTESPAGSVSTGGCREQGEMMERTPFLRLDGKQEIWAEFKRVFQEFMKASGNGEVLVMAQLARKLP